MGKPATHLSNALSFLIELKYVRREVPFGESLRSTKRSLYKINDPFFNFYFTFVLPDKSRIDLGLSAQVIKEIKKKLPFYTSTIWEELCRQSVPFIIKDNEFNPSSRWWGKGSDGVPLEIDIVSESADRKKLLVGEARWTEKNEYTSDAVELLKKADKLTFARNHEIIPALFVKHKPVFSPPGIRIFGPDEVVEGLR